MFDSSYLKVPTGIPLVSYSTNFCFENVVYKDEKSHRDDIEITLLQPHYHNEIELICISKGNVTVEINNDVINAGKGDVIIINPFEMHSVHAECSNREIEYTYINFDLNLIYNQYGIMDFIRRLSNGSMKFKNHISSQKIGNSILEINSIYQEQYKNWEIRVISMLYSIFFELINMDLLFTIYGENNDDFCISLNRYLEQNYWKNITSKDAAMHLSYNHSYFCRLFKRKFNKNFSNYLMEVRIQKACRMIQNGEVKIQELAPLTGFENTSHFSKVFKSQVGMTPTEYIKSYKNNTTPKG